ncbi:MAG: histone deacetylase [Anaerolineales bacterium]
MTDHIPVAIVPSPDHRFSGHPESPSRFQLRPSHFDSEIGGRLEPIKVEAAEIAAVTRVHPLSYLDHLRTAAASAPALLDGGDTYACAGSYDAAFRAAGAALEVTEQVIVGGHALGIALARPPGHHATAERALGFCLLNNVAIAARSALDAGLERVMIVDFDVHHGNGTQDLFENESRVAYISFHQRGIFPGTGHLHERGHGLAEGTLMNVPLPAGTGHSGYLDLFRKVIPAAARTFHPDLALVSAGYDGHWRDPLAGLRLTSKTYYEIGRILAEAAAQVGFPIAYILEGGYNPEALYSGILATLAGSLGLPDPPDRLGQPDGLETDVDPVWIALKGHPLI